ncbi:ABC transporter substrate-binding protein [Desulfovibrio sp. OttesenSCG-928-C14]|nr:ABC transporter substrate-binding protein [Desulfovibrio sp. OttesenSCG-928-C14]
MRYSIILRTVFLALLLALFSQSALAAQKSEARATLEAALDDILVILSKPEFKSQPQDGPLYNELKDKIFGICDFEEFSARSMGARWRSFNDKQKSDFMDAYGDLIYQTYSGKLASYEGQKFNFIREVSSTKGDKVEIYTTIPYDGQQAAVNYRMIKKPAGWKVYNLVIENMDLINNYFNQFQKLGKLSPEQLIADTWKKANEMKASNKNAADARAGK